MIKKFVEAWDKNKGDLETYFRAHRMEEYDTYSELVRLLFTYVINPYIEWEFDRFDTNDIHKIDDGDYQGTLVYILHHDTYQPGPTDYIYTCVEYGSCSGCDTLLRIIECNEDREPTIDETADLMTLCLHILQHCQYMYYFANEHEEE